MTHYFDLTFPLLTDTILLVKKEHINNKSKTVWVEYNIPIRRKNGSERLYGDLYTYFSNLDGFRFAKGYVRQGDPEMGEAYNYRIQYLYFSKAEPPMLDAREFKEVRYMR